VYLPQEKTIGNLPNYESQERQFVNGGTIVTGKADVAAQLRHFTQEGK
jgi:hypothetical protein